MKFYESYICPKWDEDATNHLFQSIIVGGAGIAGLILFISSLLHSWNTAQSFFALLVTIACLLFGSAVFPFARNSIYIDKLVIRVVPLGVLFKFILPLTSEFSLHKELSIEIEQTWEKMHLEQDQRHNVVILSGLPTNSKRRLLRILKTLAYRRKNITLKINKNLFSDKTLRLAPGASTSYPFLFEKGDLVVMSIRRKARKYFNIQMYEKKDFGDGKDPLPPTWTKDTPLGDYEVQWKISVSGPYRLCIHNLSKKTTQWIDFDLTQCHRIEHTPAKDEQNVLTDSTEVLGAVSISKQLPGKEVAH